MKIFTASRPRWVDQTQRTFAASAALLALALVGMSTSGCGNTLYLVQVTQAEESFEEAKELGAEEHSPYECYAAEARLKEAKVQASQAEYGNASNLADEASEYAEKAILNSKQIRSEQGATPPPAGVSQ